MSLAGPSSMRAMGLLALALCASALVLVAHGTPRSKKDGVHARSPLPPQRFSLPDRPTSAYHLPTYMMHLYRSFKPNFSRPLDAMEPDAKRADTVRSLVARSKSPGTCSWEQTRRLR